MNTRHIILASILSVGAWSLAGQENICIFNSDDMVYTGSTEEVDRVVLEDDNTKVSLYNADGAVLYSASRSSIDSMVFTRKPVADVLDVVFKTDGTAEDVSPMHNVVTTSSGGAVSTYFSSTYKRYVARFGNTWAGSTSGFYKIDYSNNTAFKNALADGHTLEAVVMANYEPPIKEGEAKFFSSHESGGTGLMVCKAFRGLNGKNELAFLPHVGGDWRFASSGIVPEPQVYYHIVGVWDKEAGKSRVYIDGELKNEADAAGEFKFPKANSNWFSIGSDAGPTAQLGWNGDVVLARIYDDPLTQEEVTMLWADVKALQDNAHSALVSNVDYLSGLAFRVGQPYTINGTGFMPGDVLHFSSITGGMADIVVEGTATETGYEITIPEGLVSGQYRMNLYRGEQMQDLGLIKVAIVEQFPKAPEVVAHRGYWDTEGSAQNSLASFKKSQELGLYGSETDVWQTADGYLVLCHDESINGVSIQNSTYDQIKDFTLSNGEKLPQLVDVLKVAKEGNTKVFLEVKNHATAEKNTAAVKAILEAVKKEGVQDKMEYITFSLEIGKSIVALDPTAKVAYLGGGMAPEDVYALGIRGLQYHQTEYRNNPQWIQEAHELGMTTNVQGTNTVEDMGDMINMGIDIISTDKPLLALEVQQYYKENQ